MRRKREEADPSKHSTGSPYSDSHASTPQEPNTLTSYCKGLMKRSLEDHNTRVLGWVVKVGRRCSRAELRREEVRRIGKKNRAGKL
jgi:hypothetical protein